uniref:Lipoxygenase domain-containing protein n=1 Tax=Hucho hucho TaxID=62062 RepID=A0A4W5LEN7_9TELE
MLIHHCSELPANFPVTEEMVKPSLRGSSSLLRELQVALGQYSEEHFNEVSPCRMIQKFQMELKVFSETVNARNSGLPVPYTYMDPAVVENSVAI